MPSLLYYDPGTEAQVDEIERIVCAACPAAQVSRLRRGDLHWIYSILLPLEPGRVAYLEPFPLSPIRWRHIFLVSDSEGRVFIQNDHAKRLGEYDNTDARSIVAAALRYRAAVLATEIATPITTTED